MLIPYVSLSDDALYGLIEEFVTRDGTDYGEQEVSLSAKVKQVELGLKTGELVIYFSEKREAANIIAASLLNQGNVED